MTDSWKILVGDAQRRLAEMESAIFHSVCTSPPYFALRDYKVAGQIGLEKTIELYMARMMGVFDEVRRVLRDDGSCWVNLGDSYADDSKWGGSTGGKHVDGLHGSDAGGNGRGKRETGIAAGNLAGIPWRFAFAMQERGWILRSAIVWRKPSPMPESVTGWRWQRCRVKVSNGNRMGSGKQSDNRLTAGLNERTEKKAMTTNGKPHGARSDNGKDFASHAQWIDCPGCPRCKLNDGLILRRGSWRPTRSSEMIFQFAKTNNYYADGEPLRTRPSASTLDRDRYSRVAKNGKSSDGDEHAAKHDHDDWGQGGANIRDVWEISPEPLTASFCSACWALVDTVGNPRRCKACGAGAAKDGNPGLVDHYAAYPSELPRRCFAASTSERGVCVECGAPWARVVKTSSIVPVDYEGKNLDDAPQGPGRKMCMNTRARREAGGEHNQPFDAPETTGWRPTCDCSAEVAPAIVLDPFLGSGRSIIAARRLGLRAVGIELRPEYAGFASALIVADNPLMNASGALEANSLAVAE